ncbi:nucleoside 2-deoxyribosyltransferase [Bacillus phage SP-15]|uniref:Nucleoside 2-deoxyribosyltransferase n=1 Tax=Bacillus phage SP-15 TaxID=1792032 RepID=A0A127AWA9_9CAUD|nr:nucleoside deoxyribosyltransferase [Bacillus phage SP-15]AMM44925.1 nucleoside 2-deoxyribosyltransferase [Bacillus phage SP-15]
MKKPNIYLASPWFSKYGSLVEETLYNFLKSDDRISVYSPRRDGTKLEPGQFHDHGLRAKVFADNVNNIVNANVVVANVDSFEGHLDTGTVWEIGYAINNKVPVIIYTGLDSANIKTEDILEKVYKVTADELFGFDLSAELVTVSSLDALKVSYESVLQLSVEEESLSLFVVGPTQTPENLKVIAGIKELLHSKGIAYVGVDELMVESENEFDKQLNDMFNTNPVSTIEEYVKESDGVIAIIDDRNPLVSMTMGMAYGMKKPMISFTNFDYGVNLMLMLSIARHVKGLGELGEALDVVVNEGFDALGENNSEGVKVI